MTDHKVISRDRALELFYWSWGTERLVPADALQKGVAPVAVHRRMDFDDTTAQGDYFAMARQAALVASLSALNAEVERSRALLTGLTSWPRKAAALFLSDSMRKRYEAMVAKSRAHLEECTKIKEGLERGDDLIEVHDVMPRIRIAGRLPVGTVLWHLSLNDLSAETPTLRPVIVSGHLHDFCVEFGCFRSGESPDLNFLHTLRAWTGASEATLSGFIPPHLFGEEFSRSDEVRDDGDEPGVDLHLVATEDDGYGVKNLSARLPWQSEGEVLFSSFDAARKFVESLIERLRPLASNPTSTQSAGDG